ncbi:MAG: efflux RND transporter periplasmic adaptor subunit [Thermodesulfobacteriota bacterium]
MNNTSVRLWVSFVALALLTFQVPNDRAHCELVAARHEPSLTPAPAPLRPDIAPPLLESTERVEGAVIRPYRQATVSAEVQGVIEKRLVKEGDLVQAGSTVFEISPELYVILADRANERYRGLEAAHNFATQELRLRERLISHDAATLQEIAKATAEAKIGEHRAREARRDLELAQRDLNNCKVKAPLTGFIITVQRDAFESVQRFDQLFVIADTSKVYAVANVPAKLARAACQGTAAAFFGPGGVPFRGVVDKVEAPIDPSSQTKKVYVLINNEDNLLELGMLGHVAFAVPDRRSP